MENFLNARIEKKEFSDNISALPRAVMEEVDSISGKLLSKSSLEKLEAFDQDYENKNFYQSGKKIFLDLQKLLNETGEIDLDLKKYEN